MEGIGAAEIVLVNRRELRDALISEQSSERQRVGRIGSGLHTRSTGLLRTFARLVHWPAAPQNRQRWSLGLGGGRPAHGR